MEVFNAAVSWLEYKKERKVYAKDLFLKIRLSLFTDPALQLITKIILCFIDDSTFINEVIVEKNNESSPKKTKNFSRHCTHNSFDIVFSGGFKLNIYDSSVVRDVHSV